MNACTGSRRKIENDGLGLFRLMMSQFYIRNEMPAQWEGDVKSAFRRGVYKPELQEFFSLVFLLAGTIMMSDYVSLCFSDISFVFGWHRIAGFLLTVSRRGGRIRAGKYVDDFFGLTKAACKTLRWRC